MFLEESDKQKFIQWLDQRIYSNQELSKQFDKLGAGVEVFKQMHQRETAACVIVKNILQTSETMSLGPG